MYKNTGHKRHCESMHVGFHDRANITSGRDPKFCARATRAHTTSMPGLMFLSKSAYDRDGVQTSPPIIYPPTMQQMTLSLSDIPTNPATLIFPHVIVWNPLIQSPALKQSLDKYPRDNCCCVSILQFFTWADGRRKGMQPCIIHSVQSMVLLVGAVYRCSQDHIVYSTDASLCKG